MEENYSVIGKIIPLFDCPERFDEIGKYLADSSNLPGPRGNLTLADKFADCFENDNISHDLLNMLIDWVHITAETAPVNNPNEFLPFCGILALGAHYSYADSKTRDMIIKQFSVAMNDRRWRIREGTAMGLQRIAEKDFSPVEKYFSQRFPGSNNLEKRAFMAALAHPPILKDKKIAQFSLGICEVILKEIAASGIENRRTEDFAVLSKGLQYSISVFAAYLPDEGFAVMKKYAQMNDPDLNKIIRANLGKSRLTKKYAGMVEEVASIMESASKNKRQFKTGTVL